MKSTALSTIARVLLITSDSVNTVKEACLGSNYLGTYGEHSVFRPDLGCLEATQASLTSGSMIVDGLFAEDNERHLIWMQEKAMESSVKGLQAPSFGEELDGLLAALQETRVVNEAQSTGQTVLSTMEKEDIELLHRTEMSALLSVPRSALQTLDAHLPRYWSPYALPSEPLPLKDSPQTQGALDRVKDVLASLEFDPDIAAVVHDINVVEMGDTIRWLTGEDPESPIVSRNSFHPDTLIAADWIKASIEKTGATCSLVPFAEGFAPNVICTYFSEVPTSEIVLLSAHYDSRGTFGSTRAPGGDDDGSGTTSILHIAKSIGRKGVSFHTNVQLVLFAGEEQGLWGSKAYAKQMAAEKANLTLMIQSDMLAYHSPEEPPQLGLPATIGTPEVTQLVANVSELYSPELAVGYTYACCSDHQSFYQLGFPSTQAFERAGPIIDPMYHNSGDVSERYGYDLHQVRSIAKVTFATLLHTTGFSLPSSD